MSRFLFRTPSGILLHGSHFHSIEFAPRAAGIGTVLSWNDVKPEGMPAVTAEEIRGAARRWLQWDDFVTRIAHLIGRYDGAQLACVRDTTALSLADTWPAAIENGHAFVASCESRGHMASTMSLGGLLGLLLDALREPWGYPSEASLNDSASAQRFARIVMLASAEPALIQPGPGVTDSIETASEYATQRLLLLSARLGENDEVQPFFVRAYEIYSELLPKLCPMVEPAFQRRFGRSIGEWIVAVLKFVAASRTNAGEGGRLKPRIQLAGAGDEDRAFREVLQRIALTRGEFETRLQASRPEDALSLLRRHPILSHSSDVFTVLHPGFLMASADDGVWYGIADALVGARDKSTFRSSFGGAVERYVGRVLARIASRIPGGQVAKVPEVKSRLRCDFALRTSESLVLVDSKRTGLNARMLVGDPSVVDRIDEDLGHGCRQILQTAQDAETEGWHKVAPGLGVEAGWKPKRIVAMLMTHRPVYAWFSSSTELLFRNEIKATWAESIGPAPPMVLALRELELLEAALPQLDVDRFLARIAARTSHTVGGLQLALNVEGYKGDAYSSYYPERARSILRLRS